MANDEHLARLIEIARREDLGNGDLTTGLLADPDERASFLLLAKQRGVLAGCEVAPMVLHAYDEAIEIEWSQDIGDGGRIDAPPTTLATIRGPLGPVLSAERVLLNFLQHLCGVATLTRSYVDAVTAARASIYDTRKTTPGWRKLEKYAVRCGGGRNHREGLFDAVLIKDNHLAGVPTGRLAAAVFDMLNGVGAGNRRPTFVEVEAESVGQVEELLKVVGIDVILLDNFTAGELREAVTLRNECGLLGKVELEASGGITLETVREAALTGVERISVGAITHSATALDLSMERV